MKKKLNKKVKASFTQEMVDDLSNIKAIDIVSLLEDTLVDELEKSKRKEIYDRRKKIIDKLLK